MRVALHSMIIGGAVEGYVTHHADIPEELRVLFREAGIADWTIWRSGLHLFHLVECDDFAHAMSIVQPHPANERWQRNIGRFVDGFFGPDGEVAFSPIERVWSMKGQLSGSE
ncbi:L-rhamnose mutarotase [Microbacterium sp. SA39]|uniref:L-rhamnose mutarotase n=1 Tax=Microbacterium sp. SA39 TaxID=1263625 RepID=UPI0005FA1743|nr:L-rhamnose mutarotase [Microbacterium sp. SA39]KJQ52811.1 hypothetical protein RS85_03705 [Microbacterium sp. SA39]